MLIAVSGFSITGVEAQAAEAQYDGMPALSPDGTMVAFISDRDGNRDLWIMGADGSNPVNLTPDFDIPASLPMWSPDGQQILFSAIANLLTLDEEADIWLAPVTNQRLQNLTIDIDQWASEFMWSPNGKLILFSILEYVDDVDQGSIWVMNSDGSNRSELIPLGNHYLAAWSPDGKFISFTSWKRQQSELSSIEIETGKVRLLATGEISDYIWSPTKNIIVYETQASDNLIFYDLWLLQTDAAALFKLTDQPIPLVGELIWSPDGEHILLRSPRGENIDIGLFNLTQKSFTKITSCQQGSNAFASWFPDSKHILLQSDRSGKISIWVISVDGTEAINLIEQSQ